MTIHTWFPLGYQSPGLAEEELNSLKEAIKILYKVAVDENNKSITDQCKKLQMVVDEEEAILEAERRKRTWSGNESEKGKALAIIEKLIIRSQGNKHLSGPYAHLGGMEHR